MTRIVGIDYGSRRIGLAVGDSELALASPAAVLPGCGDAARDAAAVAAWARENECAAAVVGLPLNMSGTDSDQTRLARAFAAALEACALPVSLQDERLTSFQADQLLAQSEGRRRGKGAPGRDAIAAQVILQSFFDRQHPPSDAD
jgi:putative Holliday junction resolvase